MGVKRGGLGRNLSALLSSTDVLTQTDTASLLMLSIEQLQPGVYQPRSDISEDSLAELAQSIKQQGLLQPLVVRELSTSKYEIIAGERRWRACQLAGLTEVPVLLRQVDNETALAMALVENLQRDDLNAMDQARAMQRLMSEFGLTHQQIADLLSKSRTAVSNYIRLLNLNPRVRQWVEYGQLDMGHARCLLSLDDDEQTKAAEIVMARQLSVRQTESLVSRLKQTSELVEPVNVDKPTVYTEQLNHLAKQLQTKVKLKEGKSGQGMLMIQYDNSKNLETILSNLLSG